MKYIPTIGLEVHAQLNTRTKMFCDSLSAGGGSAFGGNDSAETKPNVNVCPICLAHPGTLPVPNIEAIKKVVKVGLALHCNIREFSYFERKNYFYPDLPKGYQISQYEAPFCEEGELELSSGKKIRIRRVHLEEDTGRLVHRPNEERMKSNNNESGEKRQIVLPDESYDLMGRLFEVHNKLGPVFKEKNYQDAIEEVLKRDGVSYEREKSIPLTISDKKVSEFFADFVVDGKILVEVKATKFIRQEDIRQVLRYLKAADLPLAIIVNFRRDKLEYKRLINPTFHARIENEFDRNSIKFDKNSGEGVSLVDFNRAGVPLMELVTEPDIESAKEAREFGEELQLLLRYLDVSGADMEKGQLRLEANVSVRRANDKRIKANKNEFDRNSLTFDKNSGEIALGTKVELKNINSFRALERAIDYEIKRQSELLDSGKKITQETRGWDELGQKTVAQRTKEESEDYRYFPEPDIPPVRLEQSQIEAIRAELPELPAERRARFQKEYGIKPDDAEIFTVQKELGDYFEEVVSELGVTSHESRVIKLAANYLITEVQKLITNYQLPITQIKITPENFAELMVMIHENKVSSSAAQQILKEMFERGIDPSQLLEELNLTQVSDEEELRQAAMLVIEENPKAVADYKKGKEASLTFLVGQLMRHMHGRANPTIASEILKKLLT